MKILSVKVTNFGSYPELEFSFDNQGLCLISGPTGAGKSTLMDTVTWCLYGCTAKAGSVEDVRSWKSNGESTTGHASVRTGSGEVTVCRTRGAASSNDLYWTEPGKEPTRGKDINDTQRLLEARLGLTADQFIASSYLHEFSSVGNFFTSNAKARRELLEGLTDLDLPIRLAERSSDCRRVCKSDLESLSGDSNRLSGKLEQLKQSESATKEAAEKWRKDQKAKIKECKIKAETFEAEKIKRAAVVRSNYDAWQVGAKNSSARLESSVSSLRDIVKDSIQFDLEEADILSGLRCSECGSLPDTSNAALIDCRERRIKNTNNIRELKTALKELDRVGKDKNPYANQLKALEDEVNHFYDNLEELQEEDNPFDNQYDKLQIIIRYTEAELSRLDVAISDAKIRISDLTHLYELSFVLRGALLKRAIAELQDSTNSYLEKYFDAELRISFEMKDSDTLDVSIQKSGYECNFKQLSRGQRALLKLTFGISIMKASANQAGQHPNLLFFDEVLDGIDTDLKVKAVSLFEELSTQYDTVMVIDHATEVKNSFDKNYKVELIGDESFISE